MNKYQSHVGSSRIIRGYGPVKYFVLLVGVLVSGCVCTEDGGSVAMLETDPSQSLASVKDNHLAQVYGKAPFVNDREYAIRWYPNSIEITTFMGLNIPDVRNTMAIHESVDISGDSIARAFIEVAKARGHIVKMYNAKANEAIVGCVKQRTGVRTLLRADVDPTLVEYDSKGKMVATLVRIHRLDSNMVTQNHFVISKIYLGTLAKTIDTQLGGQKGLNGKLIRTI